MSDVVRSARESRKTASPVELKFATLVDLLQWRSQHEGDRTAFIFLENGETESERLTYAELDNRARAIASELQKRCFCGDRALLLYPPGLEFIAAFFGCLYAGIVAIPVYPPRRNQTLLRLQAIVTDANAKLALTDAMTLEGFEARKQEEKELNELEWLASDRLTSEENWQKPTVKSQTLAYLQYTSGSTGTPKGVMVTHENVLVNLEDIDRGFEHGESDKIVTWLPTFHDMGLIYGVLEPIYKGIICYMMAPAAFLQRPRRWLQVISRYGATHSGGPNFAYDLCTRKVTSKDKESLSLSQWRVAFNGSEPVRPNVLQEFEEWFSPCGFKMSAFSPSYGLAEAALKVTAVRISDEPTFYPISIKGITENKIRRAENLDDTQVIMGCGYSEIDTEIAIVDPETSRVCESDRVGEIWISGQTVAEGYWRRTEETKQTFEAYLASEEGPFLRTGDLGFLKNGELFVTGRTKDIIIIRGRNHYPQDIEQTVENCNAALRPGAGAAFAVELAGEERLVIVQEVERTYLRKLDADRVIGDIRQAVAAQHDLQVYAVVLVKTASIPKTSSGKIQRRRCSQMFLDGTLNVVADWGENPQCKSNFVHLKDDIDLTLKQIKNYSLR